MTRQGSRRITLGRALALLVTVQFTLSCAAHPAEAQTAPGAPAQGEAAPDQSSGWASWPPILRERVVAAYDFTRPGQVLRDLGGRGLDGQLGSSAGEDTHDPRWQGNRLLFDGKDDFVGLPLAADPNRDFTSYLVVRMDEPRPGPSAVLAFGSDRDNTPYLIVYKGNGDRRWALYLNTDTKEQSAQGVLEEVVPGFAVLALKRRGDQFELWELRSGQHVTVPALGRLSVNRKTLGANVRQVLSSVSGAQIAWQHDLARATTPQQDRQTLAALRTLLAARGIELP